MLMPFENRTVMEQRIEFILLASSSNLVKIKELCWRFKISRKTGYKWLNRYKEGGFENLKDKTRRPHHSPGRYKREIEDYVVKLREQEPDWGSKKLKRIMHNHSDEGIYPFEIIPCKNTINRMIKRNGLIEPDKSKKSKAWQRFEYDEPNELWQIDFKGYFSMLDNKNCHPLAIIDDHSRFNIGLFACSNQKSLTVKAHLIEAFEKYGLPERMLSDHGTPWGTTGQESEASIRVYSSIEKWLIRLNIKLIHGRPYHPQTQGKEERFNKTFKVEVLNHNNFKNIDQCQEYFNKWREKYNCIRPHEALNLDVPAKHYAPSSRSYSSYLPPVEYDDSCVIRKVNGNGDISFNAKTFTIGKAFVGDYVGIKPVNSDGLFEVYYINQHLRNISLRE
jgi:transposase InsO family protein